VNQDGGKRGGEREVSHCRYRNEWHGSAGTEARPGKAVCDRRKRKSIVGRQGKSLTLKVGGLLKFLTKKTCVVVGREKKQSHQSSGSAHLGASAGRECREQFG